MPKIVVKCGLRIPQLSPKCSDGLSVHRSTLFVNELLASSLISVSASEVKCRHQIFTSSLFTQAYLDIQKLEATVLICNTAPATQSKVKANPEVPDIHSGGSACYFMLSN